MQGLGIARHLETSFLNAISFIEFVKTSHREIYSEPYLQDKIIEQWKCAGSARLQTQLRGMPSERSPELDNCETNHRNEVTVLSLTAVADWLPQNTYIMVYDTPELRRQLVNPRTNLVQLNSRSDRDIPVLIDPLLSLSKRAWLVGPKHFE